MGVITRFLIKTWVFIACFIVYFSFYYIKIGFLPDLLNLKSISPSDLYQLLIGATSSIFGIVVTVVLLAFQLLKKVSLRRKEENIVYNWKVTSYVCVATFIIIFSTFSFVQTKTFSSVSGLTQAYFLLELFIVFIIMLFPLSISILNDVDNLKKTLTQIKHLKVADFEQVNFSHYTEGNFSSRKVNGPIFKIRYEIQEAVKNVDNSELSTILLALNEKAIELIGDGERRQEVDQILDGLTNLWRFSHAEGVRSSNQQYYSLIWDCILLHYKNAAEKKIYLLHYRNLSTYTYEYINFLSRNKASDSLIAGIKPLSESFGLNLTKNCPKQEEISRLYNLFDQKKIGYDQRNNMQWDDILEILSRLEMILSASISISDQLLFKSTSLELYRIFDDIIRQRHRGVEIYKEAAIAINICTGITYNSARALISKMFEDTLEVYRFDGQLIASVIRNERFYGPRILRILSDFIINSQRSGQLNEWRTFDSFCSITSYITDQYSTNATAKKSISFIMNTIVQMKEDIERTQWPNEFKNYNEIQKQLKLLFDELKKGGVTGNELKEIETALNSFKVHNAEPTSSIIPWD